MSDSTAVEYIKANFEPNDRLAVVLIEKRKGAAVQRIAPAQRIIQPDAQAWLHKMNDQRFEVYISQNALTPEARTRHKPDVAEIRHVYAEFDIDATEHVAALNGRKDMPTPNHVIESSPSKFQVIWRVEGFEKDQAEEMMRSMVRELGADPACTDCSRVLRVPGFHNHKYEQRHLVTVQNIADTVYRPEDFPQFHPEPQERRGGRHGTTRAEGAPISQSERDWANVKRSLARGVDPDQLVRELAAFRHDKANPEYYATRTVTRALNQLDAERARSDSRRPSVER